MTFLKKHYLFILICVGIIILGYLANKVISLQSEAIADKIANMAMTAERAKFKKIADKYVPLFRERQQQLDSNGSEIVTLAETVTTKNNTITAQRKEIAKLKGCDDKLIATTVLLDQSQGLLRWANNEYRIKIQARDMLWYAKQALFLSKISDLHLAEEELVLKYGQSVKQNVLYKLDRRKRLNLGVFAGYGLNGQWAAGIGITFDIIKLPVSVF